MASSLSAKSRRMLETGSAVLAHPIRLFSHLCWLSNSIFHLLIPAVPDCMAFLAGLYILTTLSFLSWSGMPEVRATSGAPSTVIRPGAGAGMVSSFLASFSLSFSWMSENTRADLDRPALWLLISLVDLRSRELMLLMLLIMSLVEVNQAIL